MTGESPGAAKTSRWLPATVFSIFALALIVDVAAVLLHDNDAGPNTAKRMEIVFARSETAEVIEVADQGPTRAADGTVLVRRTAEGLVVRAPGELRIRFLAPDAGSTLAADYRFGRRRPGSHCSVSLARVASRHGVDTVWRRELDGGRQARGKIRYYLADHAGWFALAFDVNPIAAETGFRITVPKTSWERPPTPRPGKASR